MSPIARFGFLTSAAVLFLGATCAAPAADTAPLPAAAAAPLRVGVAPNSPPMIYKEGNNIVGVEADFAKGLGRELGREIKFVEMPFADLIDALNDNKIDIIMSSMSRTIARQFRVAFSDPYFRVAQMGLVRAEDKYRYALLGSSIAGEAIGVKKATTGDLVAQQEFTRCKIKYYDSGEDAAKALKKKKIAMFINDSTLIWYLAGVHEADGLVAAPMLMSDETLAWAMRRSDGQLTDAVNAFLKKIVANGEYKEIIHRWIPALQ
jgi:polar amino acid transport system substrate-binding protein